MDELGNNVKKFNKEKSMKLIKIIIAFIVILFVAIIGIGIYMAYLQQKEFKVYVDGKIINSYPKDLVSIENDEMYFSIKDFGKLVGYTPNNGEYKGYSEDTASCYLQNNNEAATYTLNSTKMFKNVITETTDESKTTNSSSSTVSSTIDNAKMNREYFQLEKPVKQLNDKLYTTLQGMSIGCNSYISYDQKSNSLKVYTLQYLEKSYTNKIKNAAVAGEKALFSNKKGILYDLVVVQDPTNQLFGVSSTENQEVIGKKYSEIKFIESTQTFLVKTTEGKMGIISKDGTTRIKPEYDDIKQIDNTREYYLVKNDNKYGLINNNGKIIIFIDYDQIGLDLTKFKNLNQENDYVLYKTVLPVKKGDKWGLIDLNGNMIVDTIYDNLGCVETSSKEKAIENVLLIPQYEGIVVCKDKKYGLINSTGNELIPPLVSDFYGVTTLGKTTYYLTYDNQKLDVLDYLQNTLKIPPVEKTGTVSTDANINSNNTNTNTTANTTNTVENTTTDTNKTENSAITANTTIPSIVNPTTATQQTTTNPQ